MDTERIMEPSDSVESSGVGTHLHLFVLMYIVHCTLIKKKTKFFSYIRKFRWDRLQRYIVRV
jgi:hypothetical protein